MDKIIIPEMKSWRRLTLSRTGNGLNKRLMKRLADWNRELRPPADIHAALELTDLDLSFLEYLARRPDGWLPFDTVPEAPVDLERLAGLGLVRLGWPARRIRLTDAGRFLLVLTAVKPA